MNAGQLLLQTPIWKDILAHVLTFIYSIAHYTGLAVVHLLNWILPSVVVPADLSDPIGYLAVLTVFLVIVQVARKVAWIIVLVGWALIVVRIVMVAFS
ncbi:MAG: hypothetical protein AABZ02_03575 [Bacteroidota bacterium]|jgi:hypothetical protein